ncbi:ATP-dependent helicase [Candidatus Saccharibacteria bacterium]|nr:ATP-dependent helicase [Candidatus Saccharibacteria bacterium]
MVWLRELNAHQQRAVEAADGPVVIVAGPGTGKTKTLTARIAYLIESGRAKPEQILALTFTRKAAEEMKSRVAAFVSGESTITTFHGLCYELLGDEMPFASEAQRLQIIKSLPRPKGLKHLSVRELALAISRAKNQPELEDVQLAKVVRVYNKALAGQGLRDFDDLLVSTYNLLKRDEAARKAVQARYTYVLVDEFQDTNLLQYEILKLLLPNNSIFVIGDPNQSIYGFRGASGTIFDRFRQDFPDRTEITLTTNYRSVPAVVRLSNALFEEAPDLTAHSQTAGMVRAVEVLNEYSEARWVLDEIHRAIGGGDFLRVVSDDEAAQHRRLSDFAVLYRSRPATTTFQKLLDESGLPYQVVGDGSPYDQPEIQAIIALMRTAVTKEPLDLEGYTSAEQRYLRDALDRVDEALPSALVQKIIDILGIEPSREIQQFMSVLVRFKTVSSAVAYFDDIAEHGFYDPNADAITLLTIHASKGLEFPYVFLIGAEEGILPSSRGDEAEEKRLFYVAATRARERLEITHARNRGGESSEPSRFIRQLPVDVLTRHTDPGIADQLRRIAKRAAKNSQTSLF